MSAPVWTMGHCGMEAGADMPTQHIDMTDQIGTHWKKIDIHGYDSQEIAQLIVDVLNDCEDETEPYSANNNMPDWGPLLNSFACGTNVAATLACLLNGSWFMASISALCVVWNGAFMVRAIAKAISHD